MGKYSLYIFPLSLILLSVLLLLKVFSDQQPKINGLSTAPYEAKSGEQIELDLKDDENAMYRILSMPKDGTIKETASGYLYEPKDDFIGSDSFRYEACTFKNKSKISICHIPPGNEDAQNTIFVSLSAVSAHLEHGDYLGECDNSVETGSGSSVKTSTSKTKSDYTCDSFTVKINVQGKDVNNLEEISSPIATPIVTTVVTPSISDIPSPSATFVPTVTPEPSLVPSQNITPEITPEVTPIVTPEITIKITPEVTPEITPVITPLVTPVATISPMVSTTITPTPAPINLPISPVLECVEEREGGRYIAHFGYNNPNTIEVGISLGGQNEFFPQPQSRNQPLVFQKGRQVNVFTVEFDGSNLVWKLSGKTSTASSKSKRCNSAPIAIQDKYTTNEDVRLEVGSDLSLIKNDFDSDYNDLITVNEGEFITELKGKINIHTGGSFEYDPPADINGIDTFHYTICDKLKSCSDGEILIDINSINDGPSVKDDFENLLEDSEIYIDVLANDFDIDDGIDKSSLKIQSQPKFGKIVNSDDMGIIQYIPESDYFGDDSFRYEVCDFAGECRSATVFLTIVNDDDMPILKDDLGKVFQARTSTFDVLANDYSIDGEFDLKTFAILLKPVHGEATIDAISNTIIYKSVESYFGEDSLTYSVCSDNGLCGQAVLAINIIKDKKLPVLNSDEYSVAENTKEILDVVANDISLDSIINANSIKIISNPQHSVLFIEDGKIVFIPHSGYSGEDNFMYEVCEMDGDCDEGSVKINILHAVKSGNSNNSVVVSQGSSEDSVEIIKDSTTTSAESFSEIDVSRAPRRGLVEINFRPLRVSYIQQEDLKIADDSFEYEECDKDGKCTVNKVNITSDKNGNLVALSGVTGFGDKELPSKQIETGISNIVPDFVNKLDNTQVTFISVASASSGLTLLFVVANMFKNPMGIMLAGNGVPFDSRLRLAKNLRASYFKLEDVYIDKWK